MSDPTTPEDARAAARGHAALLAGLPLFDGYEPEWLERLGASLEPMQIRGGDTLLREGEPGDAMYILVHGRLRAFARVANGTEAVLNDVSAGEWVGELALLGPGVRTSTVRALRDSTLLRLSAAAFEHFVLEHPRALLRLTRGALSRVHRHGARRPAAAPRTFALVPAGTSPIPDGFAEAFVRGLEELGTTLMLRRGTVDAALGTGAALAAPGGVGDGALVGWLHEAEQAHAFTVYVSEPVPDAWSERCLRQADQVVLVGMAGEACALAPCEIAARRARPELFPSDAVLALVQPRDAAIASGAAAWLAERPVRGHVHVRQGRHADYARLARLLAGRGLGLVLSGGVARGFAHLGVLRAIEELGIAIDAVVGASIGAIVGGASAMEWDHARIRERLVRATVTDGSLLDFTAPFAALTQGARLTRRLQREFGELGIEDLWRPFRCVSGDLSSSVVHVHTRGPVWQAVRASSALPGIFPPVRSGAHALLVDGSLVNNLPVDVMRDEMRGGRILAVSLAAGGQVALEDLPLDGVVSGWSLWLAQLNPFRANPRIPSLVQVMAGVTMVGATRSQAASAELADLVLMPPVGDIGLLRFDRHADAVEAGYRHAMERLPAWLEATRTSGAS